MGFGICSLSVKSITCSPQPKARSSRLAEANETTRDQGTYTEPYSATASKLKLHFRSVLPCGAARTGSYRVRSDLETLKGSRCHSSTCQVVISTTASLTLSGFFLILMIISGRIVDGRRTFISTCPRSSPSPPACIHHKSGISPYLNNGQEL